MPGEIQGPDRGWGPAAADAGVGNGVGWVMAFVCRGRSAVEGAFGAGI